MTATATTTDKTYGGLLGLYDVTVPEHLEAEMTVPVLTGSQAQGDLYVHPLDAGERRRAARYSEARPHAGIPTAGVQVVHGEATGNTHYLHADPVTGSGVTWAPGRVDGDSDVVLGCLAVPAGQEAWLIHTDEHGANGVGPGVYYIHRQVQATDGLDQYVQD